MRDWVRLQLKRMKRLPMHLLIGRLATWTPLTRPAKGYTLVMACMKALPSVAVANLRCISRTDLRNARELILVFDCSRNQIPAEIMRLTDSLQLPIETRIIGYTRRQAVISGLINWGWVYAWLSWSIGIAAARSRYVVLHDLDAMPIRDDFFEQLYARALASEAQWHGAFERTDFAHIDSQPFPATFELVIDIVHLRKNFRPFDGFNKLRLVHGKCVDFDTFLYAQWNSPTRAVTPIGNSALVHPKQQITTYTNFVAGRGDVSQRDHKLLVLPYLMYVGGDREPLKQIIPNLRNPNSESVPFARKMLGVRNISEPTWTKMRTEIQELEVALFSGIRDEIAQYLEGMALRGRQYNAEQKQV